MTPLDPTSMASSVPGEGTTTSRRVVEGRPLEGYAGRTPAEAATLAREDLHGARASLERASAAVATLAGTSYPESLDRTLGWLRDTLREAEAKLGQDPFTGPVAARALAAEVDTTARALEATATGVVQESGRYRKQARRAGNGGAS